MTMEQPNMAPPSMSQLGGNFTLVAQGLGAHAERVERPGELVPAFRRAIRATEAGRAAVVEAMIKPMATPQLPEDWRP